MLDEAEQALFVQLVLSFSPGLASGQIAQSLNVL